MLSNAAFFLATARYLVQLLADAEIDARHGRLQAAGLYRFRRHLSR